MYFLSKTLNAILVTAKFPINIALKVDPSPFYDACVRDACACDSGGDYECFCTAVTAYAQACTEVEACVTWRTPKICRK